MKVHPAIATLVIALTLALCGGIYVYQERESAFPPSQAPVINPKLPFQNEETWTVLQVSQNLADLGSLARKSSSLKELSIKPVISDPNNVFYDIKGAGAKARITANEGVWNPSTYSALAGQYANKTEDRITSQSTESCAETLLQGKLSDFLSENRRISTLLEGNPSSAQVHIQAALLLGTLGLNDYSNCFRDVRIALNRMVAHLAMADALGASGSDPGRMLAELIRLTLICEEKQTLSQLAKLPEDPLTPWNNWREILRLRNTADWRTGREAAIKGPLALKHEYFRALTVSISAQAGEEFLKEIQAKPDVTYFRIANTTKLSVSESHEFTKPITGLELSEISETMKILGLPASNQGGNLLKEYLDTPEGSPVLQNAEGKLEVQVAGRNFLAGYQQRALLEGFYKTFVFFNDSWGVPKYADQLRSFVNEKMPDLRFKPFLTRMLVRENGKYEAANKPCVEIIFNSPEIVSPGLWAVLELDRNGHTLPIPVPDFHSWFHPEVPHGTCFDADGRLYQIGVGDENDKAWLKELWEKMPYSYEISCHNIRLENGNSYKDVPTHMVEQWLAPILDFNIDAMNMLATTYKDQPEEYLKVMLRRAQLEKDGYLPLARYLVEKGNFEKAAEMYLEAFSQSTDRVAMANSAQWIVRYLYEKGDITKATEIAEDARDVYSGRGLSTYVWLMEKLGRWDEALATARKIDERYEKSKPLNESAYLIRRMEVDPLAKDANGQISALYEIFPKGVHKAKLADFSAPPIKGAQFDGNSPSLRSFGLRDKDVVVALNGYLTETADQYMAVRKISDEPHMSLVVWDGKSYRLVEGDMPGRRFSVDLINFVAIP